MKMKSFVLPFFALTGAALLLAPLRPSAAFDKLGHSLNKANRDVRVFDNFLDPTANNNTIPDAQFPGHVGLELALWKAVVEWGSQLHGDGSGDPLSNPLGSGAANFDAFWAGNADAPGNTGQNIVSALADCGGTGTLAFAETGLSAGWRIRFCDEWSWDDGPGTILGRWDLQGVMAHEYGHALGLAHSGIPGTTMWPTVSMGQTSWRSIESDDIAGVQCIYGVASPTKPRITATVADPGANTLTIHGTSFGLTDNEVWFTPAASTPAAVDPIVRVAGVVSDGVVITVGIPAEAGPGDVMVNLASTGGATLSNAFPTDLVGVFGIPPGPHPNVLAVTPSSVPALVPGTAQTVTLTGTDLDLTTSVLVDGVAIPSSRWTLVDSSTITLDMPQAATLGAHDLGVTDGLVAAVIEVAVEAVPGPLLEWGNGEPLNPVSRAAGLDMILAGPVGSLQLVRSSPLGPPSFRGLILDAVNRTISPPPQVIPAAGWIGLHVGALPPPAAGLQWFGRSFQIELPAAPVPSNDQSITLLP
jgi:hypothetical protein